MIFLCLAAVWLTGFGVVRRLLPRPLGWSLHNVLLFSLGIGVGAGISSCLYFLCLLATGPKLTVLAWVMALATIGALVLAAMAKQRSTTLGWAPGPATPWYLTGLFLLALVLAALMFAYYSVNTPHGEQGAWSIWNLRARFLFRSGVFWRDAFSNQLNWSHPDYPLLVPGMVALCWTLAGQESTAAPIALGFLFVFGTAGLLVSSLGVLRGKVQAFAAGILLLGTAGFLRLGAAQYGDVPLSFFLLATLALLCLQDRHPEDSRFSLLAGLTAGFAAWTRNEGAIFVAVLLVARVFAVRRFGDRTVLRRQLSHWAAGLALPLAVVVFFKLRIAPANELFLDRPAAILGRLADPGRWILTLQEFVVTIFTVGEFLLPIVLVLAVYWYLVRFRVEERDRLGLATIVIALALMLVCEFIVELVSPANLANDLSNSVNRIYLQLWPAGLLAFFLATGPLDLVAKPKSAEKAKRAPKAARRTTETR
jgi:hypothetical protein